MARPRFRSYEVIAVIALTFVVFFHQQALPPLRRIAFDDRFGAVPAIMWDAWRIFREFGLKHEVIEAALPFVTANYLHADIGHIGGNMLFFWIFANVLSQSVGRALLLAIYLFAGVVAVLVYVHSDPTSEVPMIGASGAIAGLEGAYFTFVYRWEMPHGHVWPIEGSIPPAGLALLAVFNFVLDTGAFVGHSQEGVAYGAHVGGFLGGVFAAMVIATAWQPKWRGV
jgi:membrane associated rhomboid family serine protease